MYILLAALREHDVLCVVMPRQRPAWTMLVFPRPLNIVKGREVFERPLPCDLAALVGAV